MDLLHRVRRSVAAGPRLLLVDFWTNPTHTQPLAAALMVGGFLLTTGEGDVYSVEDVHGWLQGAAGGQWLTSLWGGRRV